MELGQVEEGLVVVAHHEREQREELEQHLEDAGFFEAEGRVDEREVEDLRRDVAELLRVPASAGATSTRAPSGTA